jgi:hypothetical protein
MKPDGALQYVLSQMNSEHILDPCLYKSFLVTYYPAVNMP